MVFENILDPIFSPLLNLPTIAAVILLSFLISLIITIVYKYTTNQDLMKQLKDEMKEFQREIKELRKEPEKAMQVQKKIYADKYEIYDAINEEHLIFNHPHNNHF